MGADVGDVRPQDSFFSLLAASTGQKKRKEKKSWQAFCWRVDGRRFCEICGLYHFVKKYTTASIGERFCPFFFSLWMSLRRKKLCACRARAFIIRRTGAMPPRLTDCQPENTLAHFLFSNVLNLLTYHLSSALRTER